jgi:hypothetical protein
MTNGQRFALEPTGTTSHGWPSTGGVFVLVGKQESGTMTTNQTGA